MGQEKQYDAIVEPGAIIQVNGRTMRLRTAYPFTVSESFVNDASKCCVMDDPYCWIDRHEIGL